MDGQGKTILVVDDQESNRRLMADILAQAQYRVHQAADGFEALDRLRQTRYAAVVTDWDMPRVNGKGLVTLARFLWPETPIIIVSGQAKPSSVGELRGAYGWLQKPFAIRDLLQLLTQAIDAGAHQHCDESIRTASA